ncbi:iron transporter [Chloroflexota bacterium]
MLKYQNQLKNAFLDGIKKGWNTFLWMCKIVVPISLVVTLLQWTGWLNQLYIWLNPLMGLLDLPPEAMLPIVSGMLINNYAVIAIMTVIPFTAAQMTMIAIFSLIAHNLIMEGIVQHKSGISVVKINIFRIIAAILTVFIISQFMGDTSQRVVMPISLTTSSPILEVLKTWAIDTIYLLLKILGIIIAIMIAQESLKSLGWLDYITGLFRSFMKVMGLSRKTTLIWLTAAVFGLLYGSAVIINEAKRGTLTKDELDYIHLSIGINHALIEDPFLFAVLGLNLFWLWIPRFITAIVAVHLYRLIKLLRYKLLPQT